MFQIYKYVYVMFWRFQESFWKADADKFGNMVVPISLISSIQTILILDVFVLLGFSAKFYGTSMVKFVFAVLSLINGYVLLIKGVGAGAIREFEQMQPNEVTARLFRARMVVVLAIVFAVGVGVWHRSIIHAK